MAPLIATIIIVGLVLVFAMLYFTIGLIRSIDNLAIDLRVNMQDQTRAIHRLTKVIEDKKCDCKTKVVMMKSRKRNRRMM